MTRLAPLRCVMRCMYFERFSPACWAAVSFSWWIFFAGRLIAIWIALLNKNRLSILCSSLVLDIFFAPLAMILDMAVDLS